MRIALTGATGLLGRNLLFEVLKQNLNNLDDLEIIVFGRSKNNLPLIERLKDILANDGCYYLGIDMQNDIDFIKKIESCIIPVEFDLGRKNLGISTDDFEKIKTIPIDYFFHLAALSDFRTNELAKRRLEAINIKGTNHILDLFDILQVKEAIYTGSAYSCGNAQEIIGSDYVSLDENFRNYYEESKLIAEVNFCKYAQERKCKYRIFRPVGICGRLIEKPIGSICKYDLFYGWAAFFLKHKLKLFKSFDKIYEKPLELSIRIACNLKGGLNIIPADYAAKIIYAVCIYDDPGSSYYLANDKEIQNKIYLPLILNELNLKGYSFVGEEPKDKNETEKKYYKFIGKIYTPYLLLGHEHFNNENLINIRNKTGLICPPMNKKNFLQLIKYAKAHYFGLKYNEEIVGA